MPIGIHYSDAEITFVFIPREDRLQQLTFSNYFGADNPQTHMSAGGHATRHVDSAAGLLSPLQKWVRSNIESRKAARLKEAYGNNCMASSALALPSEISSELAQVVPSDFDSSPAGASKPIANKSRPDRSSPDASAVAAGDSADRGPTANEPAISLRVTTRMALVDVVATGKNGTPIADLRATDLKVLEDGRPQSIKFFSHASSDTTRPGEKRPPQLPAEVYSNRPQYRPATGPLILLLLDGLNTASSDQAYARRQMLSYLRTLKPGQSVAVFALGTDLLLLQDFTSDPQALIAALERYSSNDSLLLARGMPAMITPEMADVMSNGMGPSPLQNLIRFNQENAVNASDDRVRLTLAGLRAVARDMIGYPGRKNLIWVSSGFPVSIEFSGRNSDLSQDYAADLSRTAAILSQAQVSVYPVDARGLISNLQDMPNANEIVPTVQSSDTRAFGTEELMRTAPQVMDSHMAMEQVARDTGGRAFYNVNNLATAVSAGVEDGTFYYTLGYYPENKNWDGKFRKINLVTERKDVKLRYRPGYYAFDSTEPGGALDAHQEQSRLQELLRAIKDPLPATGVAFWAHLVRPHNGDSSTYVEFLVDANTISFAEEGTRHDCDVDFAVFAVAANGTVSNTMIENVRTRLPASEYASVRQRGLPFRMQIKLPPKGEDLRLAVRDNRTTLLGTLTIVNPVNSLPAQAKQ